MKQFIRTGAYALIIHDGQILLSRKTAGPFIHYWDLPGGGIEFTETPLEALHRELLEETALKTTNPTLLTVLSNHGEHQSEYRYHHIAVVYRLHTIIPTDHTPQEETRWFPLQSLNSTQVTPFVRQLMEQNFF